MTTMSDPVAETNAAKRRLYVFYAVTIACAAISFFGLGPIIKALSMYELGSQASPYFVPEHAFLLNFVVPISAVAISIFFLSPGLLIAAAFNQRDDSVAWLLKGFAISLGLITFTTAVVQSVSGSILRGNDFYFLVLLLIFAGLGLSVWRMSKGRHGKLNFGQWSWDYLFAALAGFAVLSIMSAKFYWENFSPDGSGVLYFSRLFINESWPFWPEDAGTIKQAPGLTSFLFVLPASWFVRLLGENEFAVRVPHVMYIGLLYVVLLGLIRAARQAKIGVTDHVLIIAALMVYSLSVIYSGGYYPYFGDSPMPGARETMVVALFLGCFYFFATDQKPMFFLIGILGYMSLPTGGLWLVLVLVAVVLIWRPLPKERLAWLLALLICCAAIGGLLPILIRLSGLPFPGAEFDLRGIVNRLRYITFFELDRLAFLFVPLGILPVVSMFFWSRQDQIARTLTAIVAIFFLFFYFQGYRVLLHHFIPAMIPPIVVMWRFDIFQKPQYWLVSRAAVAAGLLAALLLAWPAKTGLHSFSREIGRQIQTSGDRFVGFKPPAFDTFHILFGRLFPIQYKHESGENEYFGGPLVWLHYSREEKPPGQVINYVVQPLADVPPEGARLFDTHNDYGLYILDEALFAKHSSTGFTTHFGAPIFYTSREEIFGSGARRGDRFVIDLVAIARTVLNIPDKQ